MTRTLCQFLRPALSRSFRHAIRPEHAQIYRALQQRCVQTVASTVVHHDAHSTDVQRQIRLEQLEKSAPLDSYHPRFTSNPDVRVLSPRAFRDEFDDTTTTTREDVTVQVFGRVSNVRRIGSKLMFIEFRREEERLQTMAEFRYLAERGVEKDEFGAFKKVVRKGDWITVTGHPTRTPTGELTILAIEMPSILAPSLHHLPDTISDAETLAIRPHVHQLIDRTPGDVLRVRAFVYQYLRNFLAEDGFMEVETPIFDVGAGGAVARPFETVANEMSNKVLKLRVAPELYLKRLIIAGNDKVFEMGRVFRNEGVDNTHNPEFTICEFYQVGATLEDLIAKTEKLFCSLAAAVQSERKTRFPSMPDTDTAWTPPFGRLPFIPTIEQGIGRKLPDLSSDDAVDQLLALFRELDIAPPSVVNLPRLLDVLAEQYIEPLCSRPKFITNHPEALSPLSKSYLDPTTGQRIAARAELFIAHREYVNCYEEENSPFEQRRKFEQQVAFHRGKEGAEIDESYIEALEWGMPPTGGWGCGMDRLVMYFSGAKRISDVLPFGTLRNVVSMARGR